MEQRPPQAPPPHSKHNKHAQQTLPPPAAVEAELAGAQPLLDAARAAVGGIKGEHLAEIRSLRMAPDAIRRAFAPGGGVAAAILRERS